MVVYGSNINYKAMLVAKLFSQVQREDYIDSFALIAKMDSIRIVLAIAASK